jgi:hypothetical protein
MTQRSSDSKDTQPGDLEPVIGAGYVAGQLAQSLRAAAAAADPVLRERA